MPCRNHLCVHLHAPVAASRIPKSYGSVSVSCRTPPQLTSKRAWLPGGSQPLSLRPSSIALPPPSDVTSTCPRAPAAAAAAPALCVTPHSTPMRPSACLCDGQPLPPAPQAVPQGSAHAPRAHLRVRQRAPAAVARTQSSRPRPRPSARGHLAGLASGCAPAARRPARFPALHRTTS